MARGAGLEGVPEVRYLVPSSCRCCTFPPRLMCIWRPGPARAQCRARGQHLRKVAMGQHSAGKMVWGEVAVSTELTCAARNRKSRCERGRWAEEPGRRCQGQVFGAQHPQRALWPSGILCVRCTCAFPRGRTAATALSQILNAW